jgi:hypothetical protein
MTTLAEINRAIIAGTFDNAQLNEIADAIKFARSQLTKQNVGKLVVNTPVQFKHPQRGVIKGTVIKVGRKFITVKENGGYGVVLGSWRVPANMLEKA